MELEIKIDSVNVSGSAIGANCANNCGWKQIRMLQDLGRVHIASFVVGITGLIIGIVGIVLAIVFGTASCNCPPAPTSDVQACSSKLFSLSTLLSQDNEWNENLQNPNSTNFIKLQEKVQSQFTTSLQNGLNGNSAAQSNAMFVNSRVRSLLISNLATTNSPTDNMVVVQISQFVRDLSTNGVIAIGSGVVSSAKNLTLIPDQIAVKNVLTNDTTLVNPEKVNTEPIACPVNNNPTPDTTTTTTTAIATTTTCEPCQACSCSSTSTSNPTTTTTKLPLTSLPTSPSSKPSSPPTGTSVESSTSSKSSTQSQTSTTTPVAQSSSPSTQAQSTSQPLGIGTTVPAAGSSTTFSAGSSTTQPAASSTTASIRSSTAITTSTTRPPFSPCQCNGNWVYGGDMAIAFEFVKDGPMQKKIIDFIELTLIGSAQNYYGLSEDDNGNQLSLLQLVPYPNTTSYVIYPYSCISRTDLIDVVIADYQSYPTIEKDPKIQDSFNYILQNPGPSKAKAIVLVAQASSDVQQTMDVANTLKSQGYKIFTVNANSGGNDDGLAPLSSGTGYSFTITGGDGDATVATSIASTLVDWSPACFEDPSATVSPITHCPTTPGPSTTPGTPGTSIATTTANSVVSTGSTATGGSSTTAPSGSSTTAITGTGSTTIVTRGTSTTAFQGSSTTVTTGTGSTTTTTTVSAGTSTTSPQGSSTTVTTGTGSTVTGSSTTVTGGSSTTIPQGSSTTENTGTGSTTIIKGGTSTTASAGSSTIVTTGSTVTGTVSTVPVTGSSITTVTSGTGTAVPVTGSSTTVVGGTSTTAPLGSSTTVTAGTESTMIGTGASSTNSQLESSTTAAAGSSTTIPSTCAQPFDGSIAVTFELNANLNKTTTDFISQYLFKPTSYKFDDGTTTAINVPYPNSDDYGDSILNYGDAKSSQDLKSNMANLIDIAGLDGTPRIADGLSYIYSNYPPTKAKSVIIIVGVQDTYVTNGATKDYLSKVKSQGYKVLTVSLGADFSSLASDPSYSFILDGTNGETIANQISLILCNL